MVNHEGHEDHEEKKKISLPKAGIGQQRIDRKHNVDGRSGSFLTGLGWKNTRHAPW